MSDRGGSAGEARVRRLASPAAWLAALALLLYVAASLPPTAVVQRNDFEGYWTAARVLAAGEPERLYAPDHKWFTNLPVVAWALRPLAALDYPEAWRVFWWLQLTSLAAAAGVALLIVARHYGPLTGPRALLAVATVACFAPVARRCLELGQSTPLVVLLLALFQLAYHEGWRRLGGALLGLACLVKIPPLLWVVGLAARRRLDAAAAALAVVALGVAVSWAAFGPERLEEYAQRVIVDNAGRSQAAFNNRGLEGAFMRVLTDRSLTEWDTVPRPPGVTAAWTGSVLALLALLAWSGGGALLLRAWRAPRGGPPPDGLDLELAIGAVLLVLVFPVVWIHYYLLLMVPAVVLPAWWRSRALRVAPAAALLLAAGLWLASGSEVHGNQHYGRHQHEMRFRLEQNFQPLGAVMLMLGLAVPLRRFAEREALARRPARSDREQRAGLG